MTAPTHFDNKTVRDLHWVMLSPHLLTRAANVRCLSDAWCVQLRESSLHWLAALDLDPSHLHSFLRSQRNVRRLGFYFAALLEYWIRHCPSPQLVGDSTVRVVLTQQQVHAGIAGQCAGQLKLVFERIVDGCAEILHLESHIKFFAWVPAGNADAVADAAVSPVAPGDDPAVRMDDEGLAAYVGPFLGENLFHRIVEMRRKLSLSEAPAVRTFLAAHFKRHLQATGPTGDATPPSAPATHDKFTSESIVRGYLFYPLCAKSDCRGRLYGEYPVPLCEAVSPHHHHGWWTTSLDAVLACAHPASLWAVPGNGADAVGNLGGKLHWLGPAVAVATSEIVTLNDQPSSPPMPVISGIPSLGVDDCTLLTAVQLREFLEKRQHTAHGCNDCNDDGSYPAAALLFQMLPADAVVDLPCASPLVATERRIWTEVSRGFLMPLDWNPMPLRRAMPLGLKNNMRQKQRSGGATHEVDYRSADVMFSVPHTLLAVRTGADGGFSTPSWMDEVKAATLARASSFDVGSALCIAGMPEGDESLAAAVVSEVSTTWRKLGPALESQLIDLSIAVLAACTAYEAVETLDTGFEAMGVLDYVPDSISRIDGCARAALVSRDATETCLATKGAGVNSSKPEGSSCAVDKLRGGAANSRFSLVKKTVARVLMRSGQIRGAVQLLRHVLRCPSQQRLLGSLLFAALASCKNFLFEDNDACTCLVRLLGSALQGIIELPRSLIVEACQVLEIRAAHSSLVSGAVASPLVLPIDDVTLYVRSAMQTVACGFLNGSSEVSSVDTAALQSCSITTLRHLTQLLRQLRVVHLNLVDMEDLLTRLVNLHQWVYAEQLAAAASEEVASMLAEMRNSANDGISIKRADYDEAPTADNESLESIAVFLGGYNKRTDRVQRSAHLGVHRTLEEFNGQSVPAEGHDLPDGKVLQRLLLRLAQQRLNKKLVAKLSRSLSLDSHTDTVSLGLNSRGCISDVILHGEDRQINDFESANSSRDMASLPPYTLSAHAIVRCFDVVSEPVQAEAALQCLRERAAAPRTLPAIGVDAEWIGGRCVALVQLAAPGFCVLLRLHTLPKSSTGISTAALLPPSLATLLSDTSLIKLGVGIAHDLQLLRTQYGLSSRGVLDLQNIAACSGCVHSGLQRLAAEALGVHLNKRVELRCSDWEADVLSPAQIDYAAMDAHVALDIFSHFYDVCGGPRGEEGGLAAAMLAWCAPLVDLLDRKNSRTLASPSAASPQQQSTIIPPHSTALNLDMKAINHHGSCYQNENPGVEVAPGATDESPFDAQQLLARLSLLGIHAPAVALFTDEATDGETMAASASSGVATRCEPFRVKSLAMFANGSPLVVVLSSEQKLDTRRLAEHLKLAHVSRKAVSRQLRLATPQECVTVFGYRPGTMPPLGHRELATPVIVDAACVVEQPLLAGGGDFGVSCFDCEFPPKKMCSLHFQLPSPALHLSSFYQSDRHMP
jgi:prolyl-tRNA editing enzyme YbaK/EbsC (Cys-tRNA(Pro) deacylase)